MSNSSRPRGLQPTRLLCPWDFPGKSTGVGSHCLLWINLLGPLKGFTWSVCSLNWFLCLSLMFQKHTGKKSLFARGVFRSTLDREFLRLIIKACKWESNKIMQLCLSFAVCSHSVKDSGELYNCPALWPCSSQHTFLSFFFPSVNLGTTESNKIGKFI